MNLFQKLMALRNALNYGEQLANRQTWKNGAMAMSAVAGLLSMALPFIKGLEYVDPATIDDVARGVWGVVCLFNAYVHPATSKSVYMPILGKPKSKATL